MLIRIFMSIIMIGILFSTNPVYSQISNDEIQKVFSTGRSLGSAYFYLINLSNKSPEQPFNEIKSEYQNAFQSLNVTDIILEDLQINSDIDKQLNSVRLNLYNSLHEQDLSESKINITIDSFNKYYENLSQNIKSIYSDQGSWLLDLGFYTTFQMESVNSGDQAKLLLSGFNKLADEIPFEIPESITTAFNNIKALDKTELTTNEIAELKKNAIVILEYFTNYPNMKPLITELKDLIGIWQGVLFNPNCEKYNIKLTVNNDLSAVMDVNNLAKNIAISDIELIDNYFTFMFKPFGTEKLYIRFSAKLSDDIFAGEVIDVLGEKGYWVLAKTENNTLSTKNKETLTAYINSIQDKLKIHGESNIIPVNTRNLK